jgi:uncharacterized protein YkwD
MAQDTPPSSTAVSALDASTSPVRRRARRWRIVAPLIAVVAVALAAAACAPPGSSGSGPTGDMVQAMNQDRAASGLAPLNWDSGLADLAQRHANDIAGTQSLWHTDLGGLINAPFMAGWRSLGENLVMVPAGVDAWSAEDLWMGSPPHRANILNGGFNYVGVGVTTDGAGRMWMVALFGTR